MANLLHIIIQVPKSSSSVDPVATSHTPPAAGDIYDTFVTFKWTVRQAFSEIKNEEEEEESDDGDEEKTYGYLASTYLKPLLSPRRHIVENHYGIRRYGANFMIGDSIIRVDWESNLTIKDKHYKGSRALITFGTLRGD